MAIKTLIAQHIEKLKGFTADDYTSYGVNKLYFLEVSEKKGLVKIGDTHRLVETRNDETLTNASLHRSKPVTWVIAEKHDSKSFRDKEFHKFLESKGYKRELNDNGSKSEWFFITLDQALEELKSFIQKPVYKTAVLRPAQQYTLQLLKEALNEGYNYINLGACVRIGKTIISLTHSANNNSMPVYIGKNLTSQASAEADNQEFGVVEEMLSQSLHGIDELEAGDLSKKAKQIIANINKANKKSKKVTFFIDEVDDASHTQRSRDIITPVVKYYEKKDMLFQVIPMSGTRIYRGEKILKELTNGPIKEISIEYYEMQILQPTTTCRRNYTHISFYSDVEDGLSNISDAIKNKESGHNSLATIIEKLLGTNNYGFATDKKFPHWFIKFATVGKTNVNNFVKYLNRNYRIIENTEYFYAAINGDYTKSKEAQTYCKRIINENPEKICVFITQGMATTSFSVKPIGNSVVFTDNELTSDDIQALHRSATYDEGKNECNMIVVTTNGSMEHSFDDIFEDETKAATTREEKKIIYRELLNNNSMMHITTDNKSVRPIEVTHNNIEQVLDKKAKAMTNVASIMNVVNNLDEEIKENIYKTLIYKKNSSKKSKSTTGKTFDPFDSSKPEKKRNANGCDTLSKGKKEKLIRAFVENAIMVPVIAREQIVPIEQFAFWREVEVSKELFFNVYNSSYNFKDRIDTIYNLCKDESYLVNQYISKLSN